MTEKWNPGPVTQVESLTTLNTPLRIAMFSDSALPVLNGVSISVDGLIRELRRQGHSVHLFTSSYAGHKDSDPNIHRCHALNTPFAKDYPLAIPPFYGLLAEFRRHPFDIVHTHTPFTLGFVGLRWAQSHDLPIVSTYHTLYDRYAYYVPLVPRSYVRYKIAKHTNYYYNRVQHVICPSQFSRKWLLRHAIETPTSVIPTGGIDKVMLDRAEVRLKLGIDPDQRVLLYVGRLAKEKNLDLLLEAVALCFAEDPSLHLWVVGDGPYREACIEKSRKLGIGNRVRFVGFVPRSEVNVYYAASDLFVFASITETQGLVIQEAMLYGLPPVCVLGGGATENVVDGINGLLVKNDAREFSAGVQHVMRDESLYSRMASAAYVSVKDKTTKAMAENVVGVYQNVLRTIPEANPPLPIGVL